MTTTVADSDLLRESVREAFGRLSSSAEVRRVMATTDGYDPATWQRLAGELGLAGLTLPESVGGAGFGVEEFSVVLEQAGHYLLCSPLFATAALALPLLRAVCDDSALDRYAPDIVSGKLTATVALAERDGRWRTDGITAAASQDSGSWLLKGTKDYVVDGATAGLILVVARDGKGLLGVFAVDGDAPGLERTRLVNLDQTRKQARLVLTGVPAVRIGAGDVTAAIEKATAVSRGLLAAEQAGGAQHCLDMTVEYAKTRLQFGRPIGSFQAVKHRLAECLVQVESARSAALAATTAAATDDPDLEHIAAIAALTAGHAYSWVTAQTIQLHGGIGFTWEHDAHLYFKRARTSALLLGTQAELVALIAGHLDTTVN